MLTGNCFCFGANFHFFTAASDVCKNGADPAIGVMPCTSPCPLGSTTRTTTPAKGESRGAAGGTAESKCVATDCQRKKAKRLCMIPSNYGAAAAGARGH